MKMKEKKNSGKPRRMEEEKCNVIEKKTFKGQSGRLQHNRRCGDGVGESGRGTIDRKKIYSPIGSRKVI
jgi:hypothetical protein